ncbi:hypothetical protein P7K49_033594 [Saguinus oedipus]|uniref:Uncharacterized protein n=1 Tax=Saguinus oedipus TaxID=9490 RepID=A0ABQ9TSD6_SAGOE|nr:hypothetical protein P7K49_033594 [Saguinus oedipus]
MKLSDRKQALQGEAHVRRGRTISHCGPCPHAAASSLGAGWEERGPHRQADHPLEQTRSGKGLERPRMPGKEGDLGPRPSGQGVTLIPTFDSAAMHTWYAETHARHQALGITVLGSNSMVSMQDDAFPACKVEF